MFFLDIEGSKNGLTGEDWHKVTLYKENEVLCRHESSDIDDSLACVTIWAEFCGLDIDEIEIRKVTGYDRTRV